MKRNLRFGVNVNTRAPIIFPDAYSAADVLTLAEKIEATGYDTVWIGDNFFSKGRFDSVTTLGAIAARTKRVKLGTSTLLLPLRHTTWLAITWATLDQLAQGRTILNVGVGGGGDKLGGPQFSIEFDVAGVPYRRRGEYMEEQIHVLKHLWTKPGVPFEGTFHHLPALTTSPRPVQKPTPPIWITNNPQLVEGLSQTMIDRMMRRVATLADGWMTCLATPDEYRSLWGQVLRHAAEIGRNPAEIVPAYQMTLTLASSRETAAAEAKSFLNSYYGTNYPDIRQSMWGRDPMGSSDDCYNAIKALIDAGCDDFALRFAGHDQMGQVEQFTAEVLPRLRELG